MFDLIHQMRSRIIASPVFSGDRVLAAILFEQTMDRSIDGKPTATYPGRTRAWCRCSRSTRGWPTPPTACR